MPRQIAKIQTADQTLNRVQDQTNAALNPALRSIATHGGAIAALQAIQAVQAPPLLNGWANIGGAFRAAGYYKDRNRVYLCGTVTNAAGTSANVPILTLPAGYRPGGREAFTGNSGAGLRRVDITSDGNVFPTATVSAGDFITLDDISFLAEN